MDESEVPISDEIKGEYSFSFMSSVYAVILKLVELHKLLIHINGRFAEALLDTGAQNSIFVKWKRAEILLL